MTIDKRRVIRFSMIDRRDTAAEFPVHHRPRITADECFLGRENIRTGGETSVRSEPLKRARSGGIPLRVTTARPGCGVIGLGIVIPNESFLMVLGPLVSTVSQRALGQNQEQ